MPYEQYRPTGFRLLPPVVKNILIISALFYLATLGLKSAFNIDLEDILGMHYFAAEKFKPYQIVSYIFMHGSFTHILFNMFAFWMFGYVLENVWGSKRFLTYFLITGMGAALIQMGVFYFQTRPVMNAIDTYQEAPSATSFKSFMESDNFQVATYDIQDHVQTFQVKYNSMLSQLDSLAKEARFQVLKENETKTKITSMPESRDSLQALADHFALQASMLQHQSDSVAKLSVSSTLDFTEQYRRDYLNAPLVLGASGAVFGILLAFGMMFPNTRIYIYFFIPIKAKWFVIIYGAIELLSGFTNLPGDNVAHFAHLGGMLFGFILIKYWTYRQRRNLFK